MKRRILFVMLAIMLVLSMVPAAMAQDLCFGLSAEDCAAIDAASLATINDVTSFNADFSIDFSLTGLPDGDITFNLTGSGPVAMTTGDVPVNMDLAIDTSWSGPDGDGSASIGFMIVDGIAYLDAGDGNWESADIVEALSDPSIAGQMPDFSADGLAELGIPPEVLGVMMANIPTLFSIPGTISYTRDGDVFSFDMDIAAILASPEFATMMTEIAEAAGEDGAMIAGVGGMVPFIVQSSNINITQTVTGDYLTGLSFGADATLDLSAVDETMGIITFDLLFDIQLSELNSEFSFAAPEAGEPGDLDPSDIFRGMGG